MADFSPPYPLIRSRLESGKAIPFLGAGASIGGRAEDFKWTKGAGAFLPTASELASHLARSTEFPADESRLELAKVAQYFGMVGGRAALQDELRAIFDQNYPVTPLHTYLARITKPLLIITTNYDDLMERALQAEGRQYHVVVHTTDTAMREQMLSWPPGAAHAERVLPNKFDIDPHRAGVTFVYKIHGAVDRQRAENDQYVITEDDYVEFLARMMRGKAIPVGFPKYFVGRHFLFLGYGLHDWNLRVVLNRVGRDLDRQRKVPSWAVQHRPSALERRFWQDRGVEVYDLLLDDFIRHLSAAGVS
jgi:hypothetical protein